VTLNPAGPNAQPDLPCVHAFDDELARLDAVATAAALDAGELTTDEVLHAAVDRAQALDPQLHAIVAERFDAALAAPPPGRSRHGSLAALPTFIKDMVPVAGLPLTWGSRALAGGRPVRRTKGVAIDVERIGMVTLGLSAMPEFGFISSTEFPDAEPTRNPWNLERSIGGSSGGAAALVASGVVPIAHAVDGGGSTRIPAACGGLVGLKATRARVRPRADEQRLPVPVSIDGVVTRSVRDTARFYAEMERVRRNRSLPPLGDVTRPPSRRLRVGAFIDPPYAVAIDDATRTTFATTLALLTELGHHVEMISIPFNARDRDDFIAYFQMLAFLATRTARLVHGSHVTPEDYTPFTKGLASAFRAAPGRLIGVSRRLRRARARLHEVFATVDVLLSPVLATVAVPLGQLDPRRPYEEILERMMRWIPFTPAANAAGTPAISLPLGFDPAASVPVGMMFWADYGQDALLLELALEIEAARPWPGAVPSISG